MRKDNKNVQCAIGSSKRTELKLGVNMKENKENNILKDWRRLKRRKGRNNGNSKEVCTGL